MNLLFESPMFPSLNGFPQFPLDGGDETAQIRLHQVVLRPNLERSYRSIFANRAGNKNERHVLALLSYKLQSVGSLEMRHRVIRNDNVPLLLESLDQSSRGLDALKGDVITPLAQQADL